MCVRLKWLVLWSLWAARLVRQPTPLRRLRDGALLRGQLAPDGSHEQYFGIPYASSQYKYRFQAPGPAPTWNGILEAVEENIRCPQTYGAGLVLGFEDCLTLNVYSPLQARGSLQPVMAFIHGGGFFEGSGSRLLYGPDYLVSQGIILVTINYRLGAYGFLCLGIIEAPGNAGLKDQVAALKWIQQNIKSFGGDPDNVTIFGESAGGASVSYHLMSPMSTGLFHKAILQSGSSTATWARQRDPIRVATSLAKVLGYDVEDPHQLYSIFMNTTIPDLIAANLQKTKGLPKFSYLPHVPCTERPIPGVEPFLTDAPYNILTRGGYNKVPIIIGYNNEEGYYFAAMEDDDDSLSDIDFEAVLRNFDLDFPTELERREAAQQVKILYMGDDSVSRKTILKLSRLYSEPYFNLPALIETELLLQTSNKPVYSYLFQHDGWRNFPKLISGLTFWTAAGATHADELFYLFSMFPVPSMFETKMIETMTTLWTNFAKYGEPTPPGSVSRWAALSSSAPARLLLSDPPTAAPLTNGTLALQFWRQLYHKYRAH